MYKTLTREEFSRLMAGANQPFHANIFKQNEMYKLPVNTEPRLDNLTKPNGTAESCQTRMEGFLKTLRDEVSEGSEIIQKMGILRDAKDGTLATLTVELEDSVAWKKLVAFAELAKADPAEAEKDLLTDLADWFADMVVYIRSEAMKYGLPIEGVLECVMGSNFTKLPSDGIPIHDANGKFLKDMSNYIAPEGAIKTLMFGFNDATEERPVEEPTVASEVSEGVEGTEGRNERV